MNRTLNPVKKLSWSLLALFVALLQAGCAITSANKESDSAPDNVSADSMTTLTEAELKPSPEQSSPHPSQFSKETLHALLVAEIAGQRGDLELLVNNYAEVAKKTRDKGVIMRAVNAAQYARDETAVTQLATLWSEVDPDNVDAHQLAAFQLIKSRDFPDAIEHMEKILELKGPTTFDRLALHAKSLSKDEQANLLVLYNQVLERHPDNHELLFSYAMLQELNSNYSAALEISDRLLRQDDSNPEVIALRARLIKQIDGLEESLNYLKIQFKKQPQELQLGTLYGRTLIEAQQFDQAQALYGQLLEIFPDAPHLRLSFSLIALENDNPSLAKKQLLQLVDEGQHLNEAHFYLGRIADQAEATDDAIFHYQLVTHGSQYYDAMARSAYLIIKQGRPEEAATVFNNARQSLPEQALQLWQLEINLMLELENSGRALELANFAIGENPEELDLRYARAMIWDQQGQLAEMETDLRYIIDLDPDNAVALNALGYTLADKTDRIDEAYELITKAIKLEPDNPAILDSMGWVLYRRGQLPESLHYLQKAYAQFPDPEVAAHLGEVLWMLDRKADALKIWRTAHEKEPEHRVLTQTLERLSIDI